MQQALAILGGGLAGSTAARYLRERVSLVVFDKGRGPGGRCSTRRTETGTFDHGAQYFTARDPLFQAQVWDWQARGLAAAWESRAGIVSMTGFHDVPIPQRRYVGTPSMSALIRDLQQGAEVHFSWQVRQVERKPEGWFLERDNGERQGPFRAVLLAMPAPQAAALLSQPCHLRERLQDVTYEPCLAALVTLMQPAGLPFDCAVARDGADGLAWMACDTRKPGRTGTKEHWVLHSTSAWARDHLDDDPEISATALWRAFCRRTGLPPLLAERVTGHRWRYGRVVQSLGKPWLWDESLPLGWIGDGALGPRMEAAYLSGRAAADDLLRAGL